MEAARQNTAYVAMTMYAELMNCIVISTVRVAVRHTVSTIPMSRSYIIRKDLSCIVPIIY